MGMKHILRTRPVLISTDIYWYCSVNTLLPMNFQERIQDLLLGGEALTDMAGFQCENMIVSTNDHG